MTPAMRNTLILALAFLIGACTRVGHILQKEPIRTLNFTGSHKVVAQCIQARLGGKEIADDPRNRVSRLAADDRYVIYSSAKGQSAEGLTHWAITVGKYNENEGFAEWRIVTPPATGRGPTSMPVETPLSDEAVKNYWGTVEDCARRAGKTP